MKLLKTRFIPVAIDQAYQRRQKDSEGDFYRKIASQGPRADFSNTTQGCYIATPTGILLGYNNNRDVDRIKNLMNKALEVPIAKSRTDSEPRKYDQRYNPRPPADGFIVRVRAKVLGGYEETSNPWKKMFQTAVSRDNLWVSGDEQRALARGEVLPSLQRRIARFHLVDNTRGEPPMWSEKDIKQVNMKIDGETLSGNVRLATSDGKRGYEAELLGRIVIQQKSVVTFDVVALGKFWGAGRYTGGPPKGKFPLAVSFSLADGSDVADAIPPQGSRGWVDGYIR